MPNIFVIFLLTIFMLVLVGAGCDSRPNYVSPAARFLPASRATTPMPQNKISFITSDQVTIVGEYNKPAGAKMAVLLLHMMPATKESWRPLTEVLNKKGLATLAIDLRGHGESVLGAGGKKLDYKKFNDQEHQASSLDVAASLKFLQKEGFKLENVSVIGASIGANLAINVLKEYPEIKKAVALSPGLDYRGVTTVPAAQHLSDNQNVMLVAAEDDGYSAETVRTLAKESQAQTTLKVYARGEHGTALLASEPALLVGIVEWLMN